MPPSTARERPLLTANLAACEAMSKSSKRKPQPAARQQRPAEARDRQVPDGKITTADPRTFLAERQRRGARVVDVETLFEQSVVTFEYSSDDLLSDTCIECEEFLASAARNAASAIEVLERLAAGDDAHLRAALKKYVEDTGEALKQVDDRLKKGGSSLDELFPDLPSRADDTAAWRDLIGRRDVIAHKILTVDDDLVRQEADRDFRTLHGLLRNIHFVPTVSNLRDGQMFKMHLRAEELHRLPPVQPGSDVTAVPGSSLILVCQDMQQGMLTFRLARSHDNRLQLASSVVGNYNLSIYTHEDPVR